MLTPLKPTVRVFSKISTVRELVESAIIILEISFCIHPLSVLAELHFLGLKNYFWSVNFKNLNFWY